MQESVTQDRDKFLGGSDIAAVMGISPFTTRWDLLCYKAHIKENKFAGNAYTEYGNQMEEKIRAYVNSLGYDFHEDKVILLDSDVLPTRYHADGLDGDGIVLEVKTTSKIGTLSDYKYYLVQLLYGMWANQCEEGILAVYERPENMSLEFDKTRLQLFFIGMEDYESLMKEILEEVEKFRADFSYLMEHREIEEYMLPSNSALRKISTAKMKIGGINIPVSWLLENISEIKKAESDIRDELKSQMEEHSIKKVAFTDLGIKFSYVPATEGSKKMKFNEKKFKKENEKLYEQYLEETTSGARSASVRLTKMAKGEKA